ncbi:hypothetical protein [Actinomadura sp. 6N118]|uniref:hypothetical protein n=1 Tax=Actinomadura sp. 6N118 TaxID=3375151 RepID=UPI00378BE5F5
MTTPTRRLRKAARAKDSAKRRRANLAATWQRRYEQAQGDHGALAAVAFDRARAAAASAERAGISAQALYELAQMCHQFAERLEEAEARIGRSA